MKFTKKKVSYAIFFTYVYFPKFSDKLEAIWLRLSDCLYPITVQAAEPIEPIFFVATNITTRKLYSWLKLESFAS